MKKLLLIALMVVAGSSAFAQLKVSTKSLDLESQNKHKGWKIIDAGVDEQSQKTYIKFSQAVCDASSGFNTITFKGVKWNIDKLNFDSDFNYINTEKNNYSNTEEALKNNEIVLGRKYQVLMNNITNLAGGIAMPSGPIDNSYMFQNIISGTSGLTGFKLGVSYIGLKLNAEVGKTGGGFCSENATVYKVSATDVKEAKGQLWIPMFNHPVPNEGNVLFNTGNVNPDPTKTHNVFRKYNAEAQILKEKVFTFDYQCLVYGKEIEIAPGKFDYVFLTRPINYKKSPGKLVPANQYEYIRVDGITYETKEQLTITAPNSQWNITQVLEKNGAVYLFGEAGKAHNIYADFTVPKAEDYPNVQIAKIEGGKLAYVKCITQQNIQAALVNVNGEKVKPELCFRVTDLQMDVINGKFIYSGQIYIGAQRENALINAIFNQNGDLEKYIVKEADYSKGYFTFSKDKNTMYWIIQDVTEYNKWDKKAGTITPKESKQVITAPSVIIYDMASKNIKYESLKNESWGLKFNDTILLDHDDKVLLLGANITKKAKESEVVFVTIQK
ncbi:hypothetical protein [Pedobacter glucosidilyticus]|uniref:hypothetical protein n=1 Tax=Pedobacter glucosidilyticus TaxID=1122941 RepID=UPI0026ED8D18|nr:hypothetical protein [Pedobacter glucosidilyticus]